MSIKRVNSCGGVYQCTDGAYVPYREHVKEVEKLQKYKPDIYSMYIINYYEVNGGGAYELVTKYVTYNEIERVLNELANKSGITQPSVYAISKIEVEKETKFTIKLPE